MQFDKYTLSGLTQAVCEAFENYHAGQVMEAIRAARPHIGNECDELLLRHFQSVAAGEFWMGSDNQATVKFLGQRKHVEFLVWLMLTANKSDVSLQAAETLYRQYKDAIDAYLGAEFKKKLPDQPVTAESENSSASSTSEPSSD